MRLLTEEDCAALPAIYATENDGDAALVRVRLWLPGTRWEWLLMEYNAEHEEAFGLIAGHDVELGYVWLPELEELGRVVRDAAWRPTPLGEARSALLARHSA